MRARFAVAAGALVFAALIATLRWCGDPPPAPVTRERVTNERVTADAARKAESTPRRRERVGEDSEETPAAAAPSIDAPHEMDGFPAIDVRLEHADGSPAEGATVYAMRAGSPGRRRAENGLHAITDAAGRCGLPFPGEGLFDVGARINELHVFQTGVTVPRDEPLALALPAPASLVFEIDRTGAPAESDARDTLHVVTEVAGTDLEKAYPGRGETLGWSDAVRPEPGADRIELPAPRDIPLIALAGGRLVVTPRDLVAPASTSVSWASRYELRLAVVVAPPIDGEIDDGWIDLTFEERRSNVAARRGMIARWSDLDPADDGTRSTTVDLELALPGGRLAWTGPGLLPGHAELGGLLPDVVNERTIRVELTGDPLPDEHPRAHPAPPTRVRIRALLPDTRPVNVFVAHTYGGGMGSPIRPDTVSTYRVLEPGWVVAHRGLDVAGPFAVGRNGGGVHTLTLSRGGFVELAVVHFPPAGLGRFTLEPGDGGVVLVDGALLARVDVRDGLRLGPLMQGGHSFRLSLGEETVGEFTVAVTAGSEQVLTIPDAAPMR